MNRRMTLRALSIRIQVTVPGVFMSAVCLIPKNGDSYLKIHFCHFKKYVYVDQPLI